MNDLDLAQKIFGKSDKSVTTTMAMGTARSDSTNGRVSVYIDGSTVTLPTTVAVTDGDTVQITMSGTVGKTATVTGVVGGGDTQKALIEDAAKTATNFMEYTSSGLDVGNKSSGAWSGMRTRMTSAAFQVLNAAGTVLASYGSDLIELGKNATSAMIKLCGGKARIWNNGAWTQFDRSRDSGTGDTTRLSLSRGNVVLMAYDENISDYAMMQMIAPDAAGASNGILRIDRVNRILTTYGDIFSSKVLFDNINQPLAGSVNLNETAANFSYMDIFFKTNNNHFDSVRAYDPNGKNVILMTGIYNTGAIWLKSKVVYISGTVINTSLWSENNYATGEVGVNDCGSNYGDYIVITRVVGYR